MRPFHENEPFLKSDILLFYAFFVMFSNSAAWLQILKRKPNQLSFTQYLTLALTLGAYP